MILYPSVKPGCSSCSSPAPPRPAPPQRPGALWPAHAPPSCPPGGTLGGYLINQIVGQGECFLPCQSVTLCAEGLPAGLCAPYTLCAVQVKDEAPVWEEINCAERYGLTLRVAVPLLLTVRGADGLNAVGCAVLYEDVRVRVLRTACEDTGRQTTITARVRLIGCPCPSGDACFHAQLETRVTVYLLSPRPVARPGCTPPCPPMPPLYPQPPVFPHPPCSPPYPPPCSPCR